LAAVFFNRSNGAERNSSREGDKDRKDANIPEIHAIFFDDVTGEVSADTVMPSK
jgi:hypothetical protein